MAFENFPATGQPQQKTPPPANGWRNILTAGLVIALLGTWGYIIWDKNSTKETIKEKDNVIANTSSQRDELQKELEDAALKYDMIKTSSSNMLHSKDSVIYKRDRDIATKKENIRQLLAKVGATKEELGQAKKLIASLNDDIEDYKTQIETLQGEKIVLTQANDDLAKARDRIAKEFDSAKLAIKERDEVIDVASTLHASNFSITGIQEKNDGSEKETSTAKRVSKLRITFDLDENRVTSSGVKGIYVCITDPAGTPIGESSAKFSTRDGKEKSYTQKIDVNYVQGKRQTLNFDWKQNGSFNTGDYKIEVYNNGFKIGEGVRSLKKGGLFSWVSKLFKNEG